VSLKLPLILLALGAAHIVIYYASALDAVIGG
jgi:hypothetical protein